MVGSKLKRLFGSRGSKPSKLHGKTRSDESAALSSAVIRKVERSLGYVFKNKDLLVKSLTHPSYLLNSRDQIHNNQRLEFLGDSVIQLALTEALYEKFPEEREGMLTSVRSGYARGDYMAGIARRLKLNQFLLLKEKDRNAGVADQDSALCDVFESVVGAIYLDSDWETARELTLKYYGPLSSKPAGTGKVANPKGALQELVQPEYGNFALKYETLSQTGQPHDREFEIAVFCNGEQLGSGKGRSKKEAEEKAAIEAIAVLKAKK